MRNGMPTADEVLAEWNRVGHNKAAAARNLRCSPDTVRRRLLEAGVEGTPFAEPANYIKLNAQNKELPHKGEVKRYIITTAQNNTAVHKGFWQNLVGYSKWLDAELMVCGITYKEDRWRKMSSWVMKNPEITHEERLTAVWSPEVRPYLTNVDFSGEDEIDFGTWGLAPGLYLNGELNISPTAARPTRGWEGYNGANSGIIPHTKFEMKSVPTSADERPKFLYTTGACTVPHYIPRRAGQLAKHHHVLGALIVEVDETGTWWVRQLNGASGNGAFEDVARCKGNHGVLRVEGGKVVEKNKTLAGVTFGDLHAVEADEDALLCAFGETTDDFFDYSIMDATAPKTVFLHDVLSFRSQSHHDKKSWMKQSKKHKDKEDLVWDEAVETAEVINSVMRDGTKIVVVSSNHDRHGEQWMDDKKNADDLDNGRIWLMARLAYLDAIDEDMPFMFHEWILREAGVDPSVHFLERDESYTLFGSIECGLHGDDGPNGSRGTTGSLTKIGRKVNKGHDHTAAIMDGVYSAGACARRFSYMSGPSGHSVSHIFIYSTGKRAIVTQSNGWWRA